MTRTCCEVVPEKVMQLPAAAARRSQGQGQAKPAEKQHTEQRRAEGQLRRDRSESNIARLGMAWGIKLTADGTVEELINCA